MAAHEELTPHSLYPSSPKSHSPVINAQTKSKRPRPSTSGSAEEEPRQVQLLDSIRSQQVLVRLLVRAFIDLCFLSKSTEESLANHTIHKFHSRRCSLAHLETTGEPTSCPSWPRKPCGRSTQKLVPRYAASEENGLAALIPTRRPARLSLFLHAWSADVASFNSSLPSKKNLATPSAATAMRPLLNGHPPSSVSSYACRARASTGDWVYTSVSSDPSPWTLSSRQRLKE